MSNVEPNVPTLVQPPPVLGVDRTSSGFSSLGGASVSSSSSNGQAASLPNVLPTTVTVGQLVTLKAPPVDVQPLAPPRKESDDEIVMEDVVHDHHSDEEDTVTGDWSLASSDDASPPRRRPPKPTNSMNLSAADIAICQRLDAEYEQALEEREIGYSARFYSVRQSALFSVIFMIIYLTLATVFFLQQADWSVAESLLFSIYTITTVGYGSLSFPQTVSFQLYIIFFIFIGIATLTIMVAQVYQCISLEASRAQHSRDQSEMTRRGMEILSRNSQAGQLPSAITSAAIHSMSEIISLPPSFTERFWQLCDRCRHFFAHHEIGRAVSVVFPFLGLILIGAVVIGPIEGWTPVESLYFSVVSLTTVGFGDYYPTRTASIWFCIIWLPFSIGFMSLFLANVAAFYIRLSDKNIERIERQLRRQFTRAKQRAERERQEARRRALRGQEHRDVVYADEDEGDDVIEMGNVPSDREYEENGGRPRRKQPRGFNTLPTDEEIAESKAPRRPSRPLFGSKRSPKNRRDLVLMNSDLSLNGSGHEAEIEEAVEEPKVETASQAAESTMATMKDVLRMVRQNMASEEDFRGHGPEQEFFSIRSSSTLQSSLERSAIRKPSFALRALVQERFSEIIATDIAGYSSNIEIHENTLSVTIDTLKQTADKWLIPRRARKAFRSVTFEALYFVGEHGLITRGANALFDLSPFEFHGLFSPLLAAMGDAETMEGWLSSTQVLAEVDLRRDPTRAGLADTSGRRRVMRKTQERLHAVQERKSKAKKEQRVTPGSAFASVRGSMLQG